MKTVFHSKDWKITWVNVIRQPTFTVLGVDSFSVSRAAVYEITATHRRYDRVMVERLVVPTGFKTDWASTPFGIGQTAGILAAVAHDYIYSGNSKWDMKLGNDIFYRLMLRRGMSKPRATLRYWAVSVFGRLFYRGDE